MAPTGQGDGHILAERTQAEADRLLAWQQQGGTPGTIGTEHVLLKHQSNPIMGAERQPGDRLQFPIGKSGIEADIAGTEHAGRNRDQRTLCPDSSFHRMEVNPAPAPIDTRDRAIQRHRNIRPKAGDQGAESLLDRPVLIGVAIVVGILDRNLVGIDGIGDGTPVVDERSPAAFPFRGFGNRNPAAGASRSDDSGVVAPPSCAIGFQVGCACPASINPQAARECTLTIGEAESIGDRHVRVEACRVHPVTAKVEGHSRRQLLGVGAAADAVRSLEHDVVEAERARRFRRRDSGRSSANNGDVVDGPCFGHGIVRCACLVPAARLLYATRRRHGTARDLPAV